MTKTQFNKTYFLLLLYKLNNTEVCLKSTTKYIALFDDYELIVDGIEYVHSVSSVHHQLLLYYLCVELFKIFKKQKENKQNEREEQFVELISDFVYRTFGKTKETADKLNVCPKEYEKLENVFARKNLVSKYN
ncbi:hypothetical protein EHP00_1411 [Ecytonucleospora hepatopenaei]|uniref:Uncharacterized protein n=1 Tax=Ecytonucleospora hepatopenaei TaxID=646526 RepID=A0A1W0E6B6_9MICR|nr:hypothetical protein EHP00_1411 [Ecytonucleospora hepatopenaei]